MIIKLSQDDSTVIKDILRLNGVNYQYRILQEECAECITAISHYARHRDGSFKELMEELADVLICIAEFYTIHGENIAYYWDKKISRLRKKIDEKQKEGIDKKVD